MTFPTLVTPEEQFENINDFNYEENYAMCLGYNIHYIDEGNADGPIILLMHGEPTWSYLYRKMIPLLIEKGYRVIAPDLLGFGKSEKLTDRNNYSYQLLVDIFTKFIKELDIQIEVMFIQDWGSLIGFRLMETVGSKINKILCANGAFPQVSGFKGFIGHFIFKLKIKLEGKTTEEDLQADPGFVKWVAYSQTVEDFPVGNIIQGGCITNLSEEELAAYNAPFPNNDFKEGVRQLPMLVTSELRKNAQVWNDVITKWEKPFLTIFGTGDPITRGNEGKFIAKIPGAEGLDHSIVDAGHFIQEDQPEKLVEGISYLVDLS